MTGWRKTAVRASISPPAARRTATLRSSPRAASQASTKTNPSSHRRWRRSSTNVRIEPRLAAAATPISSPTSASAAPMSAQMGCSCGSSRRPRKLARSSRTASSVSETTSSCCATRFWRASTSLRRPATSLRTSWIAPVERAMASSSSRGALAVRAPASVRCHSSSAVRRAWTSASSAPARRVSVRRQPENSSASRAQSRSSAPRRESAGRCWISASVASRCSAIVFLRSSSSFATVSTSARGASRVRTCRS